jgi:hypothetical protein
MRTVELIYEASCPNVGEARAELLRAFSLAKARARWTEWDVTDPKSPERVRKFGSPTILVDGRDVSGEVELAGAACRVYAGGRGSPSATTIAAALTNGRPWRSSLAMVPAIGTALLPKVACPACWPAYAGVLGSLGLSFLLDDAYLFPLTAAFLLVAVGALAFRARSRRGFGPLALGSAAALFVLIGKFAWDSDASMYLGLALLVTASLWNSWPRAAPKSCPACEGSQSAIMS